MAILAGDIKLVASQVMNDVPEGGGAPTPNTIQDGASNSIFNDISELDRAGGRVNLRKVFASVQTTNTDTYLGSNIIVADTPDDPNVAVTIFSTNNQFDRRTDARDRIEAYLNKGGTAEGYLLENHIAGQRSIQLFHRLTSAPPTIGSTLYLVMNEGLGSEYSQYVRVTRVTTAKREFTVLVGGGMVDFEANVTTCELSDALRYDFPGSVPSRFYTPETGKTITRLTVVADAAKYYGAVPLVQAATIGSVSAKVESIFTQLVPSAQTETALIDLTAGGTTQVLLDASNGNVSYTTSAYFGASTAIYVGNSITPGSLSVAFTGGTLSDNGGDLLAGTTVIGYVDYSGGRLVFSSSAPAYSGSKTVTFKAGASPVKVADTAATQVSIENRAYNYILTIVPAPAPTTLVVSYRSQGKWYDLRDNGSGTLKGLDSSYGVGTISYSTGTVAVTLGALPDVGSEILYFWGSKANYLNRAASPVSNAELAVQLTQTGITPSSVTITWNDGTARTATDDGKGAITGSATGTINYQTGVIRMSPTNLPAGGQTYTAAYTYGPPDVEEFSAPLRDLGGNVSLTLDKTDLTPGTVELTWNLLISNYEVISETPAEMQVVQQVDPYKTVRDNGLGVLKDEKGASYGTVNYATGEVTFNPDTTVSIPFARYSVRQIGLAAGAVGTPLGGVLGKPVYRNSFSHWEYVPAGASMPIDETGHVTVRYRAVSSSTSHTDYATASNLKLDLTSYYAENIVPGSVNFTLGGKTYFDRLGSLYYDLDMSNGNATLSGSINYQTGDVTLTAWDPGQTNSMAVKSLLTSLDGQPVEECSFRIPASPIRPASVQILATKLTGGTINVTANTAGEITAAGVVGQIDYETGVVRLRFGSWVTAAGNESAIWYSADAVIETKIFKPAPVFADTIKYNAVAYSYLPLDANLLGLDPVRLPQDGRVAVFRPGDFAVVGHTGTIGPFTLTNGQTKDCGRVRLSRIRVLDANGDVINTGYTADLEAGTVTFSDVAGYSQPVTIEHRIEDMLQVSDVQISGQLAFTRQLTHEYPVGSVVSSALVAGDLRARVSAMFDQGSWDGSYKDTVVGSAATGTFNDVLAPILVNNKGASTERWTIQFTNTNTFNIIGEHVGVIGVGSTTGGTITMPDGSISQGTAPINPATGEPYFWIEAIGWGSGWSAGNVLRFNTVGALFPVWVVRTIQQGPESVTNDSFTLLIRGDVDRP